jgi:serine/threonine protein kinase
MATDTPAPLMACRDLNPRNILLTRHSDAKLGDVGLARLLINYKPLSLRGSIRRGTGSVVDTSLVGSLSYIDPEYQRSGTFSPASDIYALGEHIYHLQPTQLECEILYADLFQATLS